MACNTEFSGGVRPRAPLHFSAWAFLSALTVASQVAVQAEERMATQSPRGLEEVVVTAQKREESVQDVPIAVTAMSGGQIEDTHGMTLEDVGEVPNVQIDNFANTPNSAVFSIRGIGVVEPDPYAGNTVSVVVDGVPQYFNMVSLLDLFDIERVEILKGPQGTLFGANTTGGVINVVTRKPTGEFGGKASMTAGNWNRRDANIAVDFPIAENLLAGKVTVRHHERDGWVKNVVNGDDMGSMDVTAARAALWWTPATDFDAGFIFEHVRSRNGAPIVVSGAVEGEQLYVPPGEKGMYQHPCRSVEERCKAPDSYKSANDSVPDISDRDTYAATVEMNWVNTAVGDLVAISGYKEFDLLEYTDQDGTPEFLDDTKRTTEGWQFSQELRTTFRPFERAEVLLGAFYLRTHYEHLQDFRVQGFFPGLRQENPQDQHQWSGSLFGQVYVDLTDKLVLQVGARVEREEKKMQAGVENFLDESVSDAEAAIILGGLMTGQDPRTFDDFGEAQFGQGRSVGGFTVKEKENWDNVGGKVGLTYHLTDDKLVYTHYSRGFKSGGFTGRVGIPQDIGPYDPEEVDAYEVGFKGDFLAGLLRTNLAAFYYDYKDMQLAQIFFTEDAQGNVVQGNSIINAASSKIQGAELEVSAAPLAGLTLSAALAYLDAEYDDFVSFNANTRQFEDHSGNTLQNSPEFAGKLSANYEFPAGPGTARIFAEYSYTDEKYLTSLDNAPRTLVQSKDVVNANLDWAPMNGRWSIGLWARNLLDERYVASVFEARGVLALVNYDPPRQFGGTFKYHW